MPLSAAVEHAARQQQTAAEVLAVARGAWRLLDPSLPATTARYLSRVAPALAAAQLDAATAGADYVAVALAEQGIDVDPAGEVVPQALSGIASDGRPLTSLLRQPVVAADRLLRSGVARADAMRAGRARLDRIVTTQVADAGRVATGIGVAARRSVQYVRMLQPPSCARCAILAGRTYRYNQGFQRHPNCDCIHQPTNAAAADGLVDDPRAGFDSLGESEQDRIFGREPAQAIRDGADMAQVVNARRGMYTADGRLLTHESTTRRGVAAPGRLMPEQIYRDAASRDDAIAMLREHGYIGSR